MASDTHGMSEGACQVVLVVPVREEGAGMSLAQTSVVLIVEGGEEGHEELRVQDVS